jgi:hypothetical protein
LSDRLLALFDCLISLDDACLLLLDSQKVFDLLSISAVHLHQDGGCDHLRSELYSRHSSLGPPALLSDPIFLTRDPLTGCRTPPCYVGLASLPCLAAFGPKLRSSLARPVRWNGCQGSSQALIRCPTRYHRYVESGKPVCWYFRFCRLVV